MGRLPHLSATVLAMVVLVAMPAVAQDAPDEHGEHGQAAEGSAEEQHEGHGESGHEANRNSVGLFLGVTDEPDHDLQGTWGLEYTRVVAKMWGVGVVGEHAGGDLRNTIVIVFGVWMPWKNLEVFAGPGVEFHDQRSSGDSHEKSGGDEGADKDETYFVFRVGAGWHIHLSQNLGLVPAVYLDFVNGEKVWVYGANLTYGF